MQVNFYNTSSANNKVSKLLNFILTADCAMKEDTSIVNPILKVKGLRLTDLKNCNYLFLPDLARYYYISDIVMGIGGTAEVSAEIDVLMSHASQIRANTALVERQEYYYNPYLFDNGISIAQGSYVKASAVASVGEEQPQIYLTAIGASDREEEGDEENGTL